jgi:8-oxo-dGTP pyrophosphatase MutT (NUDIX family)
MAIYSQDWFREHAVPRLHAQVPAEALDTALPALRSDADLNADIGADTALKMSEKTRAAAVLVGLLERDGELHVLLTQRSNELPTHAGQIAFPGGKIDATDAGPVECALRETSEETGVAPEFVEPTGFLDVYQTGTGFRIVPVVGLLRAGFDLVPEPGEVTEIFDVPLAHFMEPANHFRHSRVWQGRKRQYYAMPYGDRYVWGATAGMLRNLHDRISS